MSRLIRPAGEITSTNQPVLISDVKYEGLVTLCLADTVKEDVVLKEFNPQSNPTSRWRGKYVEGNSIVMKDMNGKQVSPSTVWINFNDIHGLLNNAGLDPETTIWKTVKISGKDVKVLNEKFALRLANNRLSIPAN